MSDTPRTRAATFKILSRLQSGTEDVVSAEFAAELERELNELRRLLVEAETPNGGKTHSPDCAIALNGRHECSCGANKVGGKKRDNE